MIWIKIVDRAHTSSVVLQGHSKMPAPLSLSSSGSKPMLIFQPPGFEWLLLQFNIVFYNSYVSGHAKWGQCSD